MTQWGPEIKHDGGPKPAWVGDAWKDVHSRAGWDWDGALLHLPANHWSYAAAAIEKGFAPWAGGDSAPDDWDGGEVLFRDGGVSAAGGWRWKHGAGSSDIIGYHRKEEWQPDERSVRACLAAISSDLPINMSDGYKKAISDCTNAIQSLLPKQDPAEALVEEFREFFGCLNQDEAEIVTEAFRWLLAKQAGEKG